LPLEDAVQRPPEGRRARHPDDDDDDRGRPYPDERRPRRRNDDQPRPAKSKALLITLIVGGIVVLVGVGAVLLLIPATKKAVETDSVVRSKNNLKQMGIGFHNIAAVYNGLEPPAVGVFPIGRLGPTNQPTTGLYGTAFYHLLPHVEHDHIYKLNRPNDENVVNTGNNGSLTPGNATVKLYCDSADPSNPGTNTLLTSYCINGAVFGVRNGGEARFPALFNVKGTQGCILVFERFAVPGGKARNWNDCTSQVTYLYSPYSNSVDAPAPNNPPSFPANITTGINDPTGTYQVEFGKSPTTVSSANHPHGFDDTIQVLLGDGSVRVLTPKVNNTFTSPAGGLPVAKPLTVWAWACSVHGGTGNVPAPSGW
jgi:hypothetical protein